MNQIRIDFRAITKRFGKCRVLENIALTLASQQCILITGENGSGKTTLLRILSGLEKPNQCDVSIDRSSSESWARMRKHLLAKVMYLHQQPYLFDGTLRDNLEYAAKLNPNIINRAEAVTKAARWAGLEAIESQSANSLSGGQQQRVALARARLRNPQVMLLDEPTANLDSESRDRTMRMLREFLDNGVAIVIVTHDPDNFSDLATEHLHLLDHRIQTEPTTAPEVVDINAARQLQRR